MLKAIVLIMLCTSWVRNHFSTEKAIAFLYRNEEVKEEEYKLIVKWTQNILGGFYSIAFLIVLLL